MALGPELITNGDFSNGGTNWILGAGWSVVAEEAVFSGAAYGAALQQLLLAGTQIGKTYQFETDLTGAAGVKVGNSGYQNYTGTPLLMTAINTDGLIIRPQSDNVTLDNVSLKEVLQTTTVEVTWIDSVSAAATGNKIYRDDVEIADIANGIQIYQDATAETGTEYKYEVQAHDGAGDETTQEVLGDNMDYITTASGNLYPQDNAASTNPEVDQIGSWYNSTNGVVSSIDTDSYAGSFCLSIVTGASGTSGRAQIDFNTVSGINYKVTARAKRGSSGVNQTIRLNDGANFGYTPITTNTWDEYTIEWLSEHTGVTSFLAYGADVDSIAGEELRLDDITFVEVV